MTTNASEEKDGVVATYQSMVPSPVAELDTTPASDATCVEIASEDQSREGAVHRALREYRLLEFGCAIVVYLLAFLFSVIEVHQRPIPGIKVRLNSTTVIWSLDPSLSEPKLSEHVPMWALTTLGLGLPIATNFSVNYVLPRFCQVRVIAHDTRDFLLSFLQSMALAEFFTEFTKAITGRFRPCFYDMCKWNHNFVWDGVTNLCTDAAGEKEGRKSFPSGHASFAWATMLVLALYLLGRSRLNCENRSNSTLRGGKKSLMLFMCCAPILIASWISITRCIDNWHHYSDILAGSVIGAASALFAFNYNYGSIFSWDSAGLPLEEIHERRMLKQSANHDDNYRNLQQHTRCAPCASDTVRGPQTKHLTDRSDYIVDLSSRSRGSVSLA